MSVPAALTCLIFLAGGCDTASDTTYNSVDRNKTSVDTDDSTVDGDDATSITANRPVDRDNTSVNERDADGDTSTPFDQSNEQDDIDLVAGIRSAVVELDDLSINGQNVKIITNDGRVILRGPVDSAAERDAIVTVANEIAGAENVEDELEFENDDETVDDLDLETENAIE